MPNVYIYVVDRDVGFAPNPFHGYCSLATCKPGIRSTAQVGDWIVGVGGRRLNATGKCIFAMEVTRKIGFQEYWDDRRYVDKKPIRNGSSVRLLGDNIYHRNGASSPWQQADSHHSNADGSPNPDNVNRDTKSDRVLLSTNFFYFGSNAAAILSHLLENLGYQNRMGHSIFTNKASLELINWITSEHSEQRNRVIADPYDFFQSGKRYIGKGSTLV